MPLFTDRVSDSSGLPQPVTFADLGINVPQRTKQTWFGKIRTVQTFSQLEWWFTAFASISIMASMTFAIYRLATLPKNSDDNVLSILVIVNLVFSLFYLVHGLLQEEPYEIGVLLLTVAILFIYVILNFFGGEVNDALKLIRLIVSSVVGPIVVCLGFPVAMKYFENGNLIFRTVGGDNNYHVMCRTLFLAYTLMTFDAQALISSLVLVKEGGMHALTSLELAVIVLGTVFTTIWLLFGYLAVRLEDKKLTWIFLCLSVLQPAYVIWRFAKVPQKGRQSLLFSCTIAAGILLLIIHILLLLVMWKVYRNYGQGLKEKVYGNVVSRQQITRYGSTENIPSEVAPVPTEIASVTDHSVSAVTAAP